MRTIISLAAVLMLAAAPTIKPPTSGAQSRNESSKFQLTESFVFPNECTGELMDISDTTTVTCHDQQRADGTFSQKCEIRQDLNATGRSSGISWHGTATFKDEVSVADACNSSFTNRGTVRLISPGSDVNVFITFDELVREENCALTADQHLVSFDCRGRSR